MHASHAKRTIIRSSVILATLLALISGVTYAALVSQPSVIRSNTISTANANLKISTNGTVYGSSIDGYNFGNIIPGGAPSPNSPYTVFLRNDGTTPLDMRLSIGTGLVNESNINLAKVHLLLTPLEGGATQKYAFADLVAAHATGGTPLLANFHLFTSQTQAFKLQVSMDGDAVTGSSASLSQVDINFGAVATN